MFCVNSFGCVSTRVCAGFFRAIEQKNRELFGPAGSAVPGELSVINVGVEDFTAERAGQTVGRGLPTGSFKLYVGFLKVAIQVGLLPDLVGLAVGRRAGRLGRFMVLGLLGGSWSQNPPGRGLFLSNDRAEFIARQFPVTILIQPLKNSHGCLNFLHGQFAVLIGIQRQNQFRMLWYHPDDCRFSGSRFGQTCRSLCGYWSIWRGGFY